MKQYNEHLNINQGNVALKFSATWCVWCKRLAPLLTNIESEYPNIEFIEVDIDKYESMFDQYHLEVVPTLVLLKDGEVLDKLVNPQSIDIIEKGLRRYDN